MQNVLTQRPPVSGIAVGTDNVNTDYFNETILGQRIEDSDGNEFRVAQCGSVALPAGVLVQSPAANAALVNLSVSSYSFNVNTNDKPSLVISVTGITANQFTLGKLIVNAGTGAGQVLSISGNAATSGANTTFYLSEKASVSLDATSKVTLLLNDFNGVVINPISATQTPKGITTYPVQPNQFFLVLTRGTAGVLASGVVTAGLGVSASTTIAGAVGGLSAGGNQIGVAVVSTVTNEYRPVYVDF